ncbi:MAG: intradiol ring-cleavage dioxygenase [Rubrivivax sp.]
MVNDRPPSRLLGDLGADIGRRGALRVLAGGLGASLWSSSAFAAACTVLPEETNGPYPADGTNQANGSLVNVLLDSGIVRSDMRTSFGSLSGTASGIQLDLELTLVDASKDCAPLAGALIYLWHCTSDGVYSVYNLTDQNYLRAAGVADDSGVVKFTTIYPGCYRGRLPHIHFEIYPDQSSATGYESRLICSQLALPDDISRALYESADGYADSLAPFEEMSISTDNVFSDNTAEQLAAQTLAITGSADAGFKGTVSIALDTTVSPKLSGGPPPPS